MTFPASTGPVPDPQPRRPAWLLPAIIAATVVALLIPAVFLGLHLRRDQALPSTPVTTPVSSITLAPTSPVAVQQQAAPSTPSTPQVPAFLIGKRLGTGRTISYTAGGHRLSVDAPNGWQISSRKQVWNQPGAGMQIRAGSGVYSVTYLLGNPAPRVTDLLAVTKVFGGRLMELAYRGQSPTAQPAQITRVTVGGYPGYFYRGKVSYRAGGFNEDALEFVVIDLGGNVRVAVGLGVPTALPQDLAAARAVLHSLVITRQ